MLSILTDDKWDDHKVKIARTIDGEFLDEELWLNNIARVEHGQVIADLFSSIDLDAICGEHFVTDYFKEWFGELTKENKRKVVDKLVLSCGLNFEGGKPLFDSLKNAKGVREMRLSAYSGGAIRILFKALGGGKQAVLTGFIKKDDAEGYNQEIKKANELHSEIE